MKCLLLGENEAKLLQDVFIESDRPQVALQISRLMREPDLYRFKWPHGQVSNWQPTPVRRLTKSHGNPTVEYAYVAP